MKLKAFGSIVALAGALAFSAQSYAAFTYVGNFNDCAKNDTFTNVAGDDEAGGFNDCAYEGSPTIGKQNVGGAWDDGYYGDLSDRFSFTTITGDLIEWAYTPEEGDPLIYYVFVKLGNQLYVDGDGTTAIYGGSVSKEDLEERQGFSHISFFNGGSHQVPAPAGLGLLGAGLLGLGVLRRKVRA